MSRWMQEQERFFFVELQRHDMVTWTLGGCYDCPRGARAMLASAAQVTAPAVTHS
jgi:hypothetical protein